MSPMTPIMKNGTLEMTFKALGIPESRNVKFITDVNNLQLVNVVLNGKRSA